MKNTSYGSKGNPKRPSRPAPKSPSRPASRPPARPVAKRPATPAPKPSAPTAKRPATPSPAMKRPAPTLNQPPSPIAKRPRPVQKAPQPIKKVVRSAGVLPPKERLDAIQREQMRKQRAELRRNYYGGVGPAAAGAVVGGVAAGAAVAAAGEMAQQELDMLSQRLAALQNAAALVDIHEDLQDTDSVLYALPGEIEAIRIRGYVFANYLENKARVLAEQWAQARGRVTAAIDQRSAELQQDVNEAERALQMAYSGGQAQIGRAQSVIQQLGSKVSAAQSAIEGMFSTIDQNVTQLMGQVDAIEWTLDQAAEASFDFYEGEDFVAAVRAKLLESNKDDGPEGILHMTDDRLIFEQKEEVATKKVLFITTAKEMVQKMLFEETVGYVEQISTSQGGFLGHKSGIEIVFSPEARYTRVGLQLIGASNDAWAQLIRRVSSGEIDQERVGAHAQGVVEVSAEAAVEGGAAPAAAAESAATGEEIPTKCPNCGALFTSPIVRGMREIRCDYCGTVVRL